MRNVRSAAVAGSWYPGSSLGLAKAVEECLSAASREAVDADRLVALIAPHAGLQYSGPVAAFAYRLLRTHSFDVIVLAGPSHHVAFEGVAVWATGGFQTPFGIAPIAEECAAAIMAAMPSAPGPASAHAREHSLEMQLPFVQFLAPGVPIVPLLVGLQTAETARALGKALASAVRQRRALLIASTDLSHYHDAPTAARLDQVVVDHVSRFDADGLQQALDRQPDHACGGGPTVAVMRAARALGATEAIVLKYGDSGDFSGDKSAVVGYMAAAIGSGFHG